MERQGSIDRTLQQYRGRGQPPHLSCPRNGLGSAQSWRCRAGEHLPAWVRPHEHRNEPAEGPRRPRLVGQGEFDSLHELLAIAPLPGSTVQPPDPTHNLCPTIPGRA
ncbi:hypothetical protein NSND_60681 [Nitrospira sp. ND1]|nr:hypothetical protein NSND_60681 [Nitrospira sp. ND1]